MKNKVPAFVVILFNLSLPDGPNDKNDQERPKSISLTHNSPSFDFNIKFSGFKSRWHILFLWQ